MKFLALSIGLIASLGSAASTPTVNEPADVALIAK
jgi:hypothetical protein